MRDQGRHRSNSLRNNVAIPFISSAIWGDVARKVQTSFGAWPVVTFQGTSPEDVAIAKKNQILISAQMKDDGSFMKAVDFFLTADMYGTGIARYGWKNVTRPFKLRGFEFGQEFTETYMAEHFNGPHWEVIDPMDFWPQSGKRSINDMTWVIHRYWMDLDDIRDDANSPHPYFDPNAAAALEQHPLQGSARDEFIARQFVDRGTRDLISKESERFAKPVEIWEMWGLVPREFARDGVRNRCIAIGNARVVMKNDSSRFGDGQKPFLGYSPMPDPHNFWGMGKVEVAEKLQYTANRLANQKLDAIDNTIDPMFAISDSVDINSENLFTRAGKIIQTGASAGEDSFRAISPDLRGLQQTYPEIAQIWQYIQLALGTNDIALGMQPGQRETARGTLTRQENLLTRLMLEARLAEEGFVEPLANAFRMLDRQFLRTPHEVKILGSLAQTNPITGLAMPEERVTIDRDDMVPDYQARAVGATQQIGRNVRQQNAIGLLQIMSSNPAMIKLVNWTNFARQMFELFDFNNVDELLNIEQVPMVNQLAQDTGQSPGAVGQGVSSLEQLDPETIGALLGGQGSGILAGVQ